MKLFLIILNLLLAGTIVWQFAGKKSSSKVQYTVKRRATHKVKKEQAPVQKRIVKVDPAKELEANAKTVIKTNIFNQERCPNAAPGAQTTRLQMTLVGVSMIGDQAGAVILLKQASNHNNGFMPPPPIMGGGRRMGFMQNNNSRNNNRRGGNNNNMPMMMGPPPGMMPGMFPRNNNQNQQKKQTGSYKQYIRVGETMVNGYKLVSVTRTKAIVIRGSDRQELELQEASKNMPKGNTANRGNQNRGSQVVNQIMRGFQQMQRMQGFQNMQMMRMMRENNGGMPGGGMPGGMPGGMQNSGGRNRGNSRR